MTLDTTNHEEDIDMNTNQMKKLQEAEKLTDEQLEDEIGELQYHIWDCEESLAVLEHEQKRRLK